jgi:hypothetical protein
MKSKNHLTITGVIVTKADVHPERGTMRFTIAHNFGGRNMHPLYLKCIVPKKESKTIRKLYPNKGDAVSITAYLRPGANREVEAVIKEMDFVQEEGEHPFFTMDHIDTGRMYVIPRERCNIDEIKVEDNVLVLSTGEKVTFLSEEGARTAWGLLYECFRDGFKHLFFQERCMCSGMD